VLVAVGLAGLLGMVLAAGHITAKEPRGRLNVILVSLDAVRPDHLSCYGYARNTTPHIDALAMEGVLFTHAFSQAPNTVPSHLALFTSRYPLPEWVWWHSGEMEASTDTLTERLRRHGYVTAAFMGEMHKSIMTSRAIRAFETLQMGVKLRELPDTLFDWLTTHRDKPFFLFVHGFDAHEPHVLPAQYDATRFDPGYQGALPSTVEELAAATADMFQHPPQGMADSLDARQLEFYVERFGFDFPSYPKIPESLPKLERYLRWREASEQAYERVTQRLAQATPEDIAHLQALYDAQLYYADLGLGRLFAALKDLRLLERTLIIIVSDHGQEFGEHGVYADHRRCYDEVTRMTLIVRDPRRPRGVRVPQIVQAIDVMPTILNVLGLPIPRSAQGRSLRRLLETGRDHGRSECALCVGMAVRGLRTPDWKLLSIEGVPRELYDVRRDPTEQHNVIEDHPDVATRLEDRLDRLYPADEFTAAHVPTSDRWMKGHGYW